MCYSNSCPFENYSGGCEWTEEMNKELEEIYGVEFPCFLESLPEEIQEKAREIYYSKIKKRNR